MTKKEVEKMNLTELKQIAAKLFTLNDWLILNNTFKKWISKHFEGNMNRLTSITKIYPTEEEAWATWIIELQKENYKEKKEPHIMNNIPPLKDVDDKDEEKKVN